MSETLKLALRQITSSLLPPMHRNKVKEEGQPVGLVKVLSHQTLADVVGGGTVSRGHKTTANIQKAQRRTKAYQQLRHRIPIQHQCTTQITSMSLSQRLAL